MSSYNKKSKLVPYDFCIRYNPYKGEGEKEITEKLLYTLVVKRIKSNKPVVWFIGGDSGEGKSSTGLTLQYALCNAIGINLIDVLEHMNVMSPLEYADKLKNMLYSKDPVIKKLRCFCIHEARALVNSRDWNTELSRMISNVNAMSRAIKPLCMIIISQFIRDITTDVRYTLTYYSTISRPLDSCYGNLRIYRMYKDDRDLEKPKLKKRFLQGYIMRAKHPDADPLIETDWERTWTILKSIKLHRPPQEVYDKFVALDIQGKTRTIMSELDKMDNRLKIEAGTEDNKVKKIAEHYTENVNTLASISKKVKGKWKIKKNVRDMHGLDKKEASILEAEINEIVKTKDWNKDVLAGHGEVIEE